MWVKKMGVEKKLGVQKNRSKEIPLNFTKEIPLFFYREFPLKLKIDEKSPKVRHFLKNLKIVFFLFFLRRCLKKSSEGSKNNQKKISSCFREICEFMFKKSKKNQPPILTNFFEKKNILILFREYSNKCAETNI